VAGIDLNADLGESFGVWAVQTATAVRDQLEAAGIGIGAFC
jgi:lactam utilization protein B